MHVADEAGQAARSLVGQTVAEKYHLDRLLGVGGMGAVYAATNTWTNRRVAVKMLLQTMSGPDAVARLQQEARAASTVRHPHILDVLDMCRDEAGNFLIITELLSGESLESMLSKRGRIDAYRAAQLLVPIAAALAAAHARGIIHRDIKPDNIFLHSDGGRITPKVIDFGISKVTDDASARARTQTGAVFGTVDYMSPEQARGERVDRTTDIWALGVVLFRALTGAFPFEAPNVNAILIKIATGRAPRVREVDASVPTAVAAIVDRMLEPERSARYPDFESVLVDLLRWADAERQPPLSQSFREILSAERSAATDPSPAPSAAPHDTISDEPTVVDSLQGASAAGPTSLHWQRKSDEDLAATTKIPPRRRALGFAVAAVAALSITTAVALSQRSNGPTVTIHDDVASDASVAPAVPAPSTPAVSPLPLPLEAPVVTARDRVADAGASASAAPRRGSAARPQPATMFAPVVGSSTPANRNSPGVRRVYE